MGFSFNGCQVKQPNKTTNRNLNFQVMSCETFPPYQCLSATSFCWVHIISGFRVGADTVLYTGEKVCRGSHDLDLMCQGPWIHLPTPLTHTLPNKRCIWQQNSWMGVVCMETSLSHLACLNFSISAIPFKKNLQRRKTVCVGSYQRWLAWSPASFLWGIWFEKDQIKRIPSVDSLVLTPDPHSLGPWLSWEGASKNSSYK